MELRVKECKLEKERREKNKNKIYANLADMVYCRKKSAEIKITKCDGCSFCEEHGIDERDMEFSKCIYPLSPLRTPAPEAGDH